MALSDANRNAERSLASDMRDFVTEMGKKHGAVLLVMAGYTKSDGSYAVTRWGKLLINMFIYSFQG